MINSVHIWGFFDEDGKPKLPNGCQVSGLHPYHMWGELSQNLTRCGDTPVKMEILRDLSGYFKSITFEVEPRPDGKTDRMWHVIDRPRDWWMKKEDL